MSILIFDFDGTIADSFFIAKDVYRKLAKGRRSTDEAEVEVLRSLTARQVIARTGVKWWQIPYIAYYTRKQMKTRLGEIQSFKGMAEVLAELHKQGHQMYIASSNSVNNVQTFLQNNNLAGYFDDVHGGIGLFDKAAALRKVAAKHGFAPQDAIYIGDEARDVEATRRLGMRCVSVTWGYNNLKGLERSRPKEVVDTPKELLKALQQPAKSAK
jgi:phosphoglycolate phosphatase